jgi:hypothetical protein
MKDADGPELSIMSLFFVLTAKKASKRSWKARKSGDTKQ